MSKRFAARRFLTLAALAVTAAALALMASTTNTAAGFGSSVSYCNQLPADFPQSIAFNDPDLAGNPNCTNPSPIPNLTASDHTGQLDVPSGDYYFSTIGPEGMTSPDHFLAGDLEIADGRKVGGVSATYTLGILGGPCNTKLTVEFILYDSTTDDDNDDGLADGDNVISGVIGPGMVTDANNDGFGDASSPFVIRYPAMYNTLLDPDLDFPGGPNGPLPPRAPRARYSGMTKVLGQWWIMSLLQLTSDQLAPFDSDPENKVSPLARLGRSSVPAGVIGDDSYNVSLQALNDPNLVSAVVGPELEPCSPFSQKLMLKGAITDGGLPTGEVRMRTPPAGAGVNGGNSHLGLHYSMTRRDVDEDGLENALDACPYVVNRGLDPDLDGIDSACDPTPNQNTNNGDHDLDGVLNRLDNCALAANATQAEAEASVPLTIAAPDGGPRGDQIGDPCDPSPNVADGAFFPNLQWVPTCIGGNDADKDGWCAGAGGCPAGNDPDDTNPALGCDVDADGDGVGNHIETRAQTDPLEDCPKTSKQQAWGPDGDNNGTVNIIDVLKYKPAFNKSEDQADIIDGLVDVNESGGITAADDLPDVALRSSTVGPDQVVDIIDGRVDVNQDGAITAADDLPNVALTQAGYDRRLELKDPLTTINIVDVLAIKPTFGRSCPLPTSETLIASPKPGGNFVVPQDAEAAWHGSGDGLSGAGSGPLSVIGADGRAYIGAGNNTAAPNRWVARLTISWPDNTTGGCTGWLIGRRVAITAGHCVFNPGRGGWATSITVVPGRDDGLATTQPFGSQASTNIWSVCGWVGGASCGGLAGGSACYDYGAILLPTTFAGMTGPFFSYANLSLSLLILNLFGLPNSAARIDGYPGDLAPPIAQRFDDDIVTDLGRPCGPQLVSYEIDTAPGQSGAPAWWPPASASPTAFAIHAYGVGTTCNPTDNCGRRINAAAIVNFGFWLAIAP